MPPPTANRLTNLGYNLQTTIQKAQSVITNSLRSCDDATDVLNHNATQELLVGTNAAAAAAHRGGDSTLTHQEHQTNRNHRRPNHNLSTVLNESTSPTLEAQIWGDHKFKVDLVWRGLDRKTPETDFGGCLIVSAFLQQSSSSSSSLQRREIPVKVNWQRKCAGTIFPVDYQGVTFPITADDVSCYIRAQVNAAQQQDELGTAFCEIGPFDIDAAMRNTVQGYLTSNGTSFPVEKVQSLEQESVSSNLQDTKQKALTLFVTADEIKLSESPTTHTPFAPVTRAPVVPHKSIVLVDLTAANAFKILLRGGDADNEESYTRLAALSRRQRDIIVLTVRAFQAVKVVNSATLLEQIALNTHQKDEDFTSLYSSSSLPFDASPEMPSQHRKTELDFYLVVDQLNRQINEAIEVSSKAVREKRRASIERDALEEDINATIEMYQRILKAAAASAGQEVLRSSASNDEAPPPTSKLTLEDSMTLTKELSQRSKIVADLQSQVRETQEQARKYLEQLETLKRDHRQLKTKYQEKSNQLKAWLESPTRSATDFPRINNGSPEDGARDRFDDPMRLIELQNQIRELEQLNLTLTQNNTKQSVDIELKKEVDTLRTNMRDLEHAKEEAEQNFTYIKEKYDELEQRQKQSSSSQAEWREAISRVERSAKREVEMHQRRVQDLEVTVNDWKRRVEELTNEEIRLKRENDSLVRQVDKVKRKAEESTQELIDLNKTLLMERDHQSSTRMMDGTTGMVHLEEAWVRKVKQLEAENLELKKENENLKTKLRKLAIA